MYVRKKRRPVAEINVVPYIDVMLVLLIIFMVTAPLVQQGIEVQLPKASTKPLSQESKTPLIASINRDGDYFLNIGETQEKPLLGDELADIVALQLNKDPSVAVLVKGDGDVAYRQVVELMVLLQGAGAPSVGLMTDATE